MFIWVAKLRGFALNVSATRKVLELGYAYCMGLDTLPISPPPPCSASGKEIVMHGGGGLAPLAQQPPAAEPRPVRRKRKTMTHKAETWMGRRLGGAVASVSDATETRQTVSVCRLERGDMLVDFDARTGHNHGTKFRLRQDKFPTLYGKIEAIL